MRAARGCPLGIGASPAGTPPAYGLSSLERSHGETRGTRASDRRPTSSAYPGRTRHRAAEEAYICSYFAWHPDRLLHRPVYRLADLDLSSWQDATRASYPAPVPTQSGPLAPTACILTTAKDDLWAP